MTIVADGGDNRATTQSSFTNITTNTWAHSQMFGFFRKLFDEKTFPLVQITFKIKWEIFFFNCLSTSKKPPRFFF